MTKNKNGVKLDHNTGNSYVIIHNENQISLNAQ